MKISLINNFLPNTGAGGYAFEIFNAYKKLKVDADMLFLQSGDKLNLKDNRIKIIQAPLKSFGAYGKMLNTKLYSVKKIPNRYDIYHVTNTTITKFCRHKESVVTCHDIMDLDFMGYSKLLSIKDWVICSLSYLYTKSTLSDIKKAKKIITISNYTKKELIEHVKVKEDKIKVIPYGMNHKIFKNMNKAKIRKKLQLPLNKKIILNIGVEAPRKNIPNLIKAFYKLSKNMPNIILIRIGEKTRKVENLINKLNLSKKVLHVGQIKKEDTALFYNAADLFVFPSLYEGFGMPPLEAMACGCPVITTNKTSIPEVVGNAAILVDPSDINNMAKAMEKVLNNRDIEKKLIRNGLRRAKNFTWEKAAKQTLKVYEEL